MNVLNPMVHNSVAVWMVSLTMAFYLLGGAGRATAAEATPAGLVTFFEATSCPAGWKEAEYARGRLLLFTTKKELVGEASGTELIKAGTAPVHPSFFGGALAVALKSKWFQGANGCSNPVGAVGPYQWPFRCNDSAGELPYLQLLPCERLLDGQPADWDLLPFATVSFFNRGNGQCPQGWVAEEQGDGRFAMPLMNPGEIGKSVGQAWKAAGRFASVHSHNLSYQHTLTRVGLKPLGLFNRAGIADSDQAVTLGAGSGRLLALPLVRLLGCRKTEYVRERVGGEIPAGMTIFLRAKYCNEDWHRVADSAGRFVVGSPAGATSGEEFGGQPLSDGENRAHSHTCTIDFNVDAQNVCVNGGDTCCFAGPQSGTATAQTSLGAANVPYIQLSHCGRRKSSAGRGSTTTSISVAARQAAASFGGEGQRSKPANEAQPCRRGEPRVRPTVLFGPRPLSRSLVPPLSPLPRSSCPAATGSQAPSR